MNCYLLTQTVLLMKSKDVYEEFFRNKNYRKDSKFFDETNKKLLVK